MMLSEKLRELEKDNPFRSVNSIVYEFLLDRIITNRMKPGEIINISRLASSLSVSRSPVQYAVDRLKEDGLIEKKENRTLQVSEMKYSDYASILQFRTAVESQAAYHAAKRISQENLQTLKALLQESKKPDITAEESCQISDRFYSILILSCENDLFRQAYETYHNKMQRYTYYIYKNNLSEMSFYDMHIGLYHALKLHISDQALEEVWYIVRAMNRVIRYFT